MQVATVCPAGDVTTGLTTSDSIETPHMRLPRVACDYSMKSKGIPGTMARAGLSKSAQGLHAPAGRLTNIHPAWPLAGRPCRSRILDPVQLARSGVEKRKQADHRAIAERLFSRASRLADFGSVDVRNSNFLPSSQNVSPSTTQLSRGPGRWPDVRRRHGWKCSLAASSLSARQVRALLADGNRATLCSLTSDCSNGLRIKSILRIFYAYLSAGALFWPNQRSLHPALQINVSRPLQRSERCEAKTLRAG